MKGKFDRVHKSVRCQSLHKMEIKLSVLPQACLALGSTHRHTLNNRMAGYVAYIVSVCIINFSWVLCTSFI
jgi:hypothetical protein